MPTAVVVEVVAEVLGVSREDFGKRRRNSALRALASRFLIRYAGQTQGEVAARLEERRAQAAGEWSALAPGKTDR